MISEEEAARNQARINEMINAFSVVYKLYHSNLGGSTIPHVAQFLATSTELITVAAPFESKTEVQTPLTTFRAWVIELSTILGHRKDTGFGDGYDRVIIRVHDEGSARIAEFTEYLYSQGLL
jgi:hypothetical protein